jgi:ABC-type lipoprotein release transport system permease subunit
MALGARKNTIASLVLGTGLRLCAAGLAIGLGTALVATRYLESLLYGVGVRDPITFLAIAALLLVVATLASWLPARRAASTDPSTVLRIG